MSAALRLLGHRLLARRRSLLALLIETASFAAVAYGAWLAWEPAGWLLGGVLGVLAAQGIGGDS